MRFAENKTKTKEGFKYWTADNEVFGKMTFMSPDKLGGEQLDLLMEYLLKVQFKKGEVKVKLDDGRIVPVKFIFRKKPDWGKPEKIKVNLNKKDE